jgi:hypothetical protein
MMLLIVAIAGICFMYALITKPEIVAVLFFIITIADINFQLGGMPMNARALIGIALFVRTLADRDNKHIPNFLLNGQNVFIVIFIFYNILVTKMYDLAKPEFIKLSALTFIAVYCGYYYFFKKGNASYLRTALIIAALICFADLVFTYATLGQFPVQRIYLDMLNIQLEYDENGKAIEVINHNFFGLICGTCFVYLLNDYINNSSENKLTLVLLPIMLLGVLMSTSRSTLLGLITMSVFLIARELKNQEKAKRAYKLISLGVGSIFLALFLFTTFQSYFNLSSEFMDGITLRLIDEPIASLNKQLGLNYNVQSLDAMDWRQEASANAFQAFLDLNFIEQLFGIGFGGFVERDLGHNLLNPHNGMLLLLVESGIIGLIMYTLLCITIIRASLRAHPGISPMVTTLLFVIVYCIGQNGELTSSITFLFVSMMIAETEYLQKAPEEVVQAYNS